METYRSKTRARWGHRRERRNRLNPTYNWSNKKWKFEISTKNGDLSVKDVRAVGTPARTELVEGLGEIRQ
jgi:hypothetical protein